MVASAYSRTSLNKPIQLSIWGNPHWSWHYNMPLQLTKDSVRYTLYAIALWFWAEELMHGNLDEKMALVPIAKTPPGPAFPSGHGTPVAVTHGAAMRPMPVDWAVEVERNNPLRMFSLWLTCFVVFLRISAFHQAATFLLHVNLRLLYVAGIPAFAGTVLCGGIQRSFRAKPTFFWLGFAIWMLLAIPTATWRGAALLTTVLPYWRTDLLMLFMVRRVGDWMGRLLICDSRYCLRRFRHRLGGADVSEPAISGAIWIGYRDGRQS